MDESGDTEDLCFLRQAVRMKEAAQKKEAAISAFIQSVYDEADSFINTERARTLKQTACELCKKRGWDPVAIGFNYGSTWNYPSNLSNQLRNLNPRWVAFLGEAQLILDRQENHSSPGRTVLENLGKRSN